MNFETLRRQRDSAEIALHHHEQRPPDAVAGTPEYVAWWEEERRLLLALRDRQRALDAFEKPEFDAPLPGQFDFFREADGQP